MMDAKQGGISISMIVIASIGVIVLSIVAALVIQAGGDVTEARSCSNVGQCVPSDQACPSGTLPGSQMTCSEDARCCIRNS